MVQRIKHKKKNTKKYTLKSHSHTKNGSQITANIQQ